MLEAWLLEAWDALCTTRQWIGGGMGPPVPMPLAWHIVESYGMGHHMGHEERAILHHVLRGLDEDWLREMAQKREAAR